MRWKKSGSLAAVVLAIAAGSAHAQSYTVTECGPAGWVSSRAYDINDRGVIVGGGLNGTAQSRAFTRPYNGAATAMSPQVTTAYGVNLTGVAVAQGIPNSSWTVQGATLTPIPGLDGATQDVSAWDISDAGVVCGSSHQDQPASTQKAFVWSGSGDPVDLGDLGGNASVAYGLNEAGTVVGASRFTDGQVRAFVYRDGVMTDISGDSGGAAYAVNERGIVVGTLGGEAFMNDGANTLLGSLGDPSSGTAWAVNDFDSIVGESDGKAFLYRRGVIHDLNDLIPSGSGWQLQAARGINNHGEIIGYGVIGGLTKAFLLSPTCTADFDENGQVDFFDYLDFVMRFAEESPIADFDRNGQLDFFDYLDFGIAFSAGCD